MKAQQHDFVAERMRRERNGRSCHWKLVGLTIQIVAPAPGVKAAGPGERPEYLCQRKGTAAPPVRLVPFAGIAWCASRSACLLAVLHLISTSPAKRLESSR